MTGEEAVIRRGVDDALGGGGGDGRGWRRDVVIVVGVAAAVDGREGVISRLLDDDARIDRRGGDDGADGLLQERRCACAAEERGEKRGRPMSREFGAGDRVNGACATTTLNCLLPAVRFPAVEALRG